MTTATTDTQHPSRWPRHRDGSSDPPIRRVHGGGPGESLGSGGIFGLLGPNGAGKSTIIKMLTTLLKPSEGTALVAGFDIAQAPGEVRKRIGYVPQLLSADGALTGYENLTLSAKLYGIPRLELKPPN